MTPFRRNTQNRKDDFLSPIFDSLMDNDFFANLSNRGHFKTDLRETNDSYLVEDSKESYVRRERHHGEFRRSFYIDNVDEDKIQAKFEEGVLKIILPKLTKDDENKRKIDIQ